MHRENKFFCSMIKVILLSVALLFLAVVGMAFRVLFVKGGRFPSSHSHGCKHSN